MDKLTVEELFNDSYERVSNWALPAGSKNAFFDSFYARFIATSPEVARAFEHTDMDRQVRMLRQSIVYLVNYYANNNVNDFLRRIAVRHSRQDLDIAPELYDLWLEALIATVEEFDPRYTTDTGMAWRQVLAPGIAFMKSYYERP